MLEAVFKESEFHGLTLASVINVGNSLTEIYERVRDNFCTFDS